MLHIDLCINVNNDNKLPYCSYCLTPKENIPEYKTLNLDTAKRAIDWFLSNNPEAEVMRLNFLNIEPLLELDLIENITAYAQDKIQIEVKIRTDGRLLTAEAIDFVLAHTKTESPLDFVYGYTMSKLSIYMRSFQPEVNENVVRLKDKLLEMVMLTNGYSPRIDLLYRADTFQNVGRIFQDMLLFGFSNFLRDIVYCEVGKGESIRIDIKELSDLYDIFCNAYVERMNSGGMPLRISGIHVPMKRFAKKYSFAKQVPYIERKNLHQAVMGVDWNGDVYFGIGGYRDKEKFGIGNVNTGVSLDVLAQKKLAIHLENERWRDEANLNLESWEFNRVSYITNFNMPCAYKHSNVAEWFRKIKEQQDCILPKIRAVHNALINNPIFRNVFYGQDYLYHCAECNSYSQDVGRCDCGREKIRLEKPKRLLINDVKELD